MLVSVNWLKDYVDIDVPVDEFYAVALTNAERVLLGVFGK